MSVGATHIDHVVISANDSAAVARHFAATYGIEIKRTMSRPGTGAHLEFAKLAEVILEFAGPGTPPAGEEVRARLGGFVLAVDDIDAAVLRVREAGYEATEPKAAVQPGARIAAVKTGTHGVPLAFIQYDAMPAQGDTSS